MKKLFISTIALCLFLNQNSFSQSTLIQPANDEILTTKYGGTEPNLAGRHSSGSSTTPTATSSGLGLVTFSGRGYTGTGFTGDRVSMLMSADEAFTTTANGTRITFNTTLNGTNFQAERMRIDNTGFVGIGTVNPLKRLHVSDGSAGIASYASTSTLLLEDNTSHYIQMGSPEVNETGIVFGKPSNSASGGVIYTGTNALQFRTGGNATRMSINSLGKIGINEVAPTARLQITHDGSDTDPHLRLHTTGLYSRINWSTNTNSNVFTAQSDLESATAANNYWRLEYNSSILFNVKGNGNIGIGTSAPTAKLDIEGDIVVKKTTNTSVGTINALSRSGGSSLFMNGAGTVTVNGIAGGVDGMILYLICGNSTTLVLNHENASAAAGDRITTQTAANVTISQRGGAVLIYEASTAKWRIIGFAN